MQVVFVKISKDLMLPQKWVGFTEVKFSQWALIEIRLSIYLLIEEREENESSLWIAGCCTGNFREKFKIPQVTPKVGRFY